MSKLTIIVPVYNREKTIKIALDSIVKQLDKNTDLIIINDGSTDNTEKIIDEYTKRCSEQISYYAKENEGVAATRNFGIKHAKGEYIMFVDSDDYIEEGLINTLQTYMDEDIDIIKFKLKRVDENHKIISKIDGAVFEKQDGQAAFNELAFSDVLLDSPCVYAFKRNVFINNNLFFKVGTEHEDFGLIPLVILKAKSVVSIDVYGYAYVQGRNSITRNEDYKKTKKKMQDTIKHYDHMIEWISTQELDEQTKKNVKTYYTNAILLKLKELEKEDRKQMLKEIKQRKMISNIQVHNVKQLCKKILLKVNVQWYLKLK